MVQQRGGPVLINAVCMPQITEISLGGTAQMSCLRQALGSLQQSCVMFRKIKLLNKSLLWKIQSHTAFSDGWRLFHRGSIQQKGKLGKPAPAAAWTALLPRGTVSHHPRATQHQGGLAQAAVRNLQPHVGKSMGCVFFSSKGGSGAAFSFLGPEKWGFFVYSPRGWRVQLLFPIFGGTPPASLPCASAGLCVHA